VNDARTAGLRLEFPDRPDLDAAFARGRDAGGDLQRFLV
jgi:hypothetical protein